MSRLNINDVVKVKLTDVGLKELQRQHDELSNVVPNLGCFVAPSVDQDGYSSFQLWSLMNTFGHLMSLGNDVPFECDLILN